MGNSLEGQTRNLNYYGYIISDVKLKFLLKYMENILMLNSLKASEILQVGSKILGNHQVKAPSGRGDYN